MMCTSDKVVNGLINYADAEVIGKLPTSGKWIVGTALGLATTKTNEIIEYLQTNPVIKVLGVVDDDGNIDVDSLISALKNSADKYGKLSVKVPMIGVLTFSSSDVERLRGYFV